MKAWTSFNLSIFYLQYRFVIEIIPQENSNTKKHQFYLKRNKMNALKQQYFKELATNSHDKQKKIEQADKVSFDQFLLQYFSQK